MKIYIYILSLFIFIYPVLAEEQTEYPDSLNKPIENHGKVFLINSDNYKTINKNNLLLDNYATFNDVYYDNLSLYPVNLGESGADNNFSIFGASPLSNSFSFNNISLSNKRYNNFTMNKMPTENVENSEIFIGSNAAIFSDNSNGSYTNFQEIIYNTATPYTKFWYAQESDESIYVDGIFSQNIYKNINFSLGFRNMSSQGNYENSSFDSWNFRSSLRWFISDFSMLSLSYNHTNFGNNLNGGVDNSKSEDIYSTIDAVTIYANLRKREFSNSTQLNYSVFLDSNKTSAFSAALNVTMNKYTINATDDFNFTHQDSRYKLIDVVPEVSLSGKFEQKIAEILFRTGGEVSTLDIKSIYLNINNNYLNFHGFAHLELPFSNTVKLSGGVRYSNAYERNSFSFGSRFQFKNNTNRAFADFSISEYQPNFFQGLNLKNELHTLLIANYDYHNNETSFESNMFYRNIQNPIITNYFSISSHYSRVSDTSSFNSTNDINITGLWMSFRTEVFKDIFAKISTLNYYNLDENNQVLPYFLANINAYYQYVLKRSYMRAGVNISVLSGSRYYGYEPVTNLYYTQNKESDFSINGIDAYVGLRLGRAYVKASMYNVLGTGYYYVYLYPVKERNMRISISWSFFD